MAIPVSSVRSGNTVEFNGTVNMVLEYKHVRAAQGAVIRIKFKDIKTGAIFERTFDVNEKIEPAYVERRKFQFLYKDNEACHFMDQETFDQRTVPLSFVADAVRYLKEGLEIQLGFYENEVVGIELPRSVELAVAETAPDARGNTASGGGKPATLETGLTISVPFFMKVGDVVRVDTRDGAYIERV